MMIILTGEASFTWKNYNDGSLIQNGLPSSAYPSHGTSAASDWTPTQGIGQLYNNYGDTSVRGFIRSGAWGSGSTAGVLALNLSAEPSNAYPGISEHLA